MAGRKLTKEEEAALALLARGGRILALLIPEGMPTEAVQELVRETNARLAEWAKT